MPSSSYSTGSSTVEYCGREYSAPKGWRRAWCFSGACRPCHQDNTVRKLNEIFKSCLSAAVIPRLFNESWRLFYPAGGVRRVHHRWTAVWIRDIYVTSPDTQTNSSILWNTFSAISRRAMTLIREISSAASFCLAVKLSAKRRRCENGSTLFFIGFNVDIRGGFFDGLTQNALIKRITGAAESSFRRSSFAASLPKAREDRRIDRYPAQSVRLTGILMEYRFQPSFKISLDKLVMVWHWPT